MAYVPPPVGSTKPGEPTPQGVNKQSVHITDLPPEVRKSFLMSMVFFPSMIGAAVCALMFLGWVTIFKPKESLQYAQELGSTDMRRRWSAAREMSEHIKQYGEEKNTKIYASDTLTAVIQILENTDLDSEKAAWSPSGAIKQPEEKGSIRTWAALMTGHLGAVLKNDTDRNRAYLALAKALDDPELSLFAARGLALMRDPRAVNALVNYVNNGTDPGARWQSAEALGAIGWAQMRIPGNKTENETAEKTRHALVTAYQTESSKPKRDEILLDNLALSLARVSDSTALDRLKLLEKDTDPVVRDNARRALLILKGDEKK